MYYSHHGIPLRFHLQEVGRRCRVFFFFNLEENLESAAYLVGLTHDFGKYTTYFQDRLFEKKDWGKLSDHAFLSALYGAMAVERSKAIQKEGGVSAFLPLVSFLVIVHHHMDLRSLEYVEERLREESEYREIVQKQIANLQEHASEIAQDLVDLHLPPVEEFSANVEKLMFRLRKAKYQFENQLDQQEKARMALLLMSLFSALIDADKRSAAGLEDVTRRSLPSWLVEQYKKEKLRRDAGSIDELREEIFQRVVGQVEKLDLRKDRLLTLTAPTGSGKTLTSFALALKLRERIEKEFHYHPRIVYALPFISIIDQNFSILNEVLAQLEDFEGNSSAYILGHHHLSDLRYEEGYEEKEFDVALSLIESWEAEVIVTTFVQLLHSVVGFKNRFLRKYHNLARSIIILDEVQNVPAEYWPLLRWVFVLMAKYLGCFIVLSTATKPFIFEGEEARELLEEKETYFRSLSRVILYPRLKKSQNVEDFVQWFVHDFYAPSKSYLLVLNTISSSLEVYEGLKRYGIPGLYYLSANLVSVDKLNRIRKVKEALASGQKPVLVSTQVVEAGVDLDFDCAMRDVGPLDSIIQVAGRCNRHFRKGIDGGEVWVVSLKDERGQRYASYVYSNLLPSVTDQILREISEVREEGFLALAERYFAQVREWKSFDQSEGIYRALLSLRFYEEHEVSVACFRLIEEEGTIYPVFIEKDEEAQRVWQRFREITNHQTLKPWEKKRELLKIRRSFEAYLVNVRVSPKDTALFSIMFSKSLGYVPRERVHEFYDPETGFRKGGTGSYAIVI
ncbi:MAG: CRISPR-associated helicase Cas3' [Atribacterota bacterium]